MDEQAFRAAFSHGRNGCNYFVRHPIIRSFQFSDGVEEIANTGCWWLLDIIASECPQKMRKAGENRCEVKVKAKASRAHITLTYADNKPCLWARRMTFADIPDGDWTFELRDEGVRFALCLLTEH